MLENSEIDVRPVETQVYIQQGRGVGGSLV
jgi:hypothetical protein